MKLIINCLLVLGFVGQYWLLWDINKSIKTISSVIVEISGELETLEQNNKQTFLRWQWKMVSLLTIMRSGCWTFLKMFSLRVPNVDTIMRLIKKSNDT